MHRPKEQLVHFPIPTNTQQYYTTQHAVQRSKEAQTKANTEFSHTLEIMGQLDNKVSFKYGIQAGDPLEMARFWSYLVSEECLHNCADIKDKGWLPDRFLATFIRALEEVIYRVEHDCSQLSGQPLFGQQDLIQLKEERVLAIQAYQSALLQNKLTMIESELRKLKDSDNQKLGAYHQNQFSEMSIAHKNQDIYSKQIQLEHSKAHQEYVSLLEKVRMLPQAQQNIKRQLDFHLSKAKTIQSEYTQAVHNNADTQNSFFRFFGNTMSAWSGLGSTEAEVQRTAQNVVFNKNAINQCEKQLQELGPMGKQLNHRVNILLQNLAMWDQRMKQASHMLSGTEAQVDNAYRNLQNWQNHRNNKEQNEKIATLEAEKSKLQHEYFNSLWTSIRKLKKEQHYCHAIGFLGHSMYVDFENVGRLDVKAQTEELRIKIFNLGELAQQHIGCAGHTTINLTTPIPPFVIRLQKDSPTLNSLCVGMTRAITENAAQAKDLIYPFKELMCEEQSLTAEKLQPNTPNCTAKSYLHGLRERLGDQRYRRLLIALVVWSKNIHYIKTQKRLPKIEDIMTRNILQQLARSEVAFTADFHQDLEQMIKKLPLAYSRENNNGLMHTTVPAASNHPAMMTQFEQQRSIQAAHPPLPSPLQQVKLLPSNKPVSSWQLRK